MIGSIERGQVIGPMEEGSKVKPLKFIENPFIERKVQPQKRRSYRSCLIGCRRRSGPLDQSPYGRRSA
jgi:hypothetical protein